MWVWVWEDAWVGGCGRTRGWVGVGVGVCDCVGGKEVLKRKMARMFGKTSWSEVCSGVDEATWC